MDLGQYMRILLGIDIFILNFYWLIKLYYYKLLN